jgi:hypothetical protein
MANWVLGTVPYSFPISVHVRAETNAAVCSKKVKNVLFGIRPICRLFVNQNVPNLEKLVQTVDCSHQVTNEWWQILTFVFAPRRPDRGELPPETITEDRRQRSNDLVHASGRKTGRR